VFRCFGDEGIGFRVGAHPACCGQLLKDCTALSVSTAQLLLLHQRSHSKHQPGSCQLLATRGSWQCGAAPHVHAAPSGFRVAAG
jgi:hypothetical protein